MSLMHERPGAELLDTEAGEFKRLVEPPAPPDNPEAPRRWPLLVAAIVIAAVISAGGVWWLLDSTVSQSDYDDLAAELDATEEQLSDADAALVEEQAALNDAESALSTLDEELASALAASAQLRGDFEALESENASLAEDLAAARAEATGMSADLGELQATLEGGREAVEALVLMYMNFGSDFLDELTQSGVDVTVFDDLLAQLGRDETTEEWAASWDDFDGAWGQADRAVHATNDEALIDLWQTWNFAEAESDEGYAVFLAMYARAYELMLERLTPVG